MLSLTMAGNRRVLGDQMLCRGAWRDISGASFLDSETRLIETFGVTVVATSNPKSPILEALTAHRCHLKPPFRHHWDDFALAASSEPFHFRGSSSQA